MACVAALLATACGVPVDEGAGPGTTPAAVRTPDTPTSPSASPTLSRSPSASLSARARASVIPTGEAADGFTCRDSGVAASFGAPGPGTRLPPHFHARTVVSCATDDRTTAAGGTELVAVERRGIDQAAMARLVAALRLPDQPTPPDTICPAVGYGYPWLFLLDGSGHAVRPREPRGVCGGPRVEVGTALDALALRIVDTWPIRALVSPEAARTGCSQSYSDVVRMDTLTGNRPPAAPLGGDPFAGTDAVRSCVYRVPAEELGSPKPGGEFFRGAMLIGSGRARLGALLAAAPAAMPCVHEATRFAVLGQSNSGPAGYVELDGCQRVLVEDASTGRTGRRLAQAPTGLIALLGE